MNKDMMKRLRRAAGYQKKAVRALLPEGMEDHLDVIEKEMKAMFGELLVDLMCESKGCGGEEEGAGDGPERTVKKVTIA